MGRLRPEEISSILKGAITDYENRVRTEEVGQVLEVGDGIARVHGLQNVMYQEMLEFEDARGEKITGLALNLEEDNVGAIIAGDDTHIQEGNLVRRTERLASVPVGEGVLGRVIDALTDDMALSTRNFLKVLSDNGREEILEEVLLRYEELVKEHLGKVEVEVTTAVELSEEEVGRINERLGRLLEGREVILDTSVDPEILGGAVFRFGGRRVDSSVRGQLLSLREEMLERSVV